MLLYKFYFLYFLLVHLSLCIRYRNRNKTDSYLKTNYKLLKKRKKYENRKNKFANNRKGNNNKIYDGIYNNNNNIYNDTHKNRIFFRNEKKNEHVFKTNKYSIYEKRNKIQLNSATSTFVSKYYKININDVYNYLHRKKYEFIETDIKITLKYCPFCPPHKYKYDNMYKHEIFKNTGNSYCHRCGYKGSFYDFKLKMGDLVTSNFESNLVHNNNVYEEEEKITLNDVKVYNMNLLYSKEAENARNYLINVRKLSIDTLKKFLIGFSVMEFQSFENSGKFEKHECIIFPFIKKVDELNTIEMNTNNNHINTINNINNINNNNNIKDNYEVVRIKIRSLKDKGYMRLYPKNVRDEMKLFFFGDHLVKNSEEIVLTEGEIDAMTISQETKYPAISLPNGSKSLPIYLLPYLERFKKIHLWLDFDKAGKSSVFNFVNKIGLGRTNVITDANVHYLNPDVFKRRQKSRLTKKSLLLTSLASNAMEIIQKDKEQAMNNIYETNNNDNMDNTTLNNNLKSISNEKIEEKDNITNNENKSDNNNNNNNLKQGIEKKQVENQISAIEDNNKKNNIIENHNNNMSQKIEGEKSNQDNISYFIDNNIMYIPNNIIIKDANDCLKHNIDIRFFIETSEKVKHSQILNFNDLRQRILEELKYPDRINGVKSKTIPSLNKYLYGLRMGELSIWTGSTGVGKTTLLSQLSLDYCIQGVSTLWGSFEINNVKLGKVMLNQFCGKNLEKNIDLFDIYADKFELLPLKFLKFHGSTNIDQVIDAMDYAVYAYDVKHIIIDNLQFMLNINKFSDIYELQNIAIDKFRSFSTNKNVHITLVVHPRKEDNNLLSISSVFGSVKSTQEADNVFIIQRHVSKTNETVFFIDIKKNRFKGSLGKIPYLYNKENMTIKEISINNFNENIVSNTYLPSNKFSSSPLQPNIIKNNTSNNNNFIQNDNLNFTLCDEYDYMKQLADEYESKHAFKKGYKSKLDPSLRVKDADMIKTEIIDNNNKNVTLYVDSSENIKTISTDDKPNNIKRDVNEIKTSKNNEHIKINTLKIDGNKSLGCTQNLNYKNVKNDNNNNNNNMSNQGMENNNIDDKSSRGNNKNINSNSNEKKNNNNNKSNSNSSSSSSSSNNYNNNEGIKNILNSSSQNNPPFKDTIPSYTLTNEGLIKLCEELRDEEAEKLKNRVVVLSMRNCIIDNNSSIKDIRTFIKTNKLNIKTAGKNLKKMDIFISILQNIPKEYITIKSGEKYGPNKGQTNDKSKNKLKDTHNSSNMMEYNKVGSNMYDGQNTSCMNTNNIYTEKQNNNINKDPQILLSNDRNGSNYDGCNNINYEMDKNGNEGNVNDYLNRNYENNVDNHNNDEITKKYIKDNIINVDDNIIKKKQVFKLKNENNEMTDYIFEYFESKKKFDDDIESRFFIINDNNYNKNINLIYKDIKYCGLDIETTGLEVFDENIRLIQIAVENYPVIIYDMFNINKKYILDGLRKVLENKNIIKIIQNGKFDAKFLLHNNFKIENIFDTYIASKLLDKNKNMYGFKLNNIVEKYLNVILDKQQQNSVWNNSLLNNNQLFYAARDSSCLLKLYKKLKEEIRKENLHIVNDIENKCILPICDMELNGIKVDLENLQKSTNEILNELNIEKDNLKKKLKDEEINVNSQQQVLKALQKNNVRDISNKLIENTSDANLKNFLNHEEIISLRNYRRLYKLYSAFYLKLPLHINTKTNKIHTTFNQLKTFSGRFSSEKPNLQQIPRQKNIREIFIPNDNNIFIIADFKQIELKIAAEITNDEIMLKAYNNNIDLHTLTASIITKKSISDINKDDRHIAKAINFGLIYGMNYVNLKNYANTYYGLNMTLDQCLYFYNSFFEHYKGIYKWHNQVKQKRALQYSTLSNRKVIFPYFSFTKALNYPVQGTCADILKLALVDLYDNLKNINGKIILCVHDEIIIEVDKKFQEEALKILVQSMENSASYFLKKVKCEVSVKIAENWGSKD
ncbi:plastid replication-repair enzyme [Plasmodium sp. DRC-Itaito]|nr:plastid replication-repair enzyme [Plasmodium sp. DRC-Itaito]